jgi:hypothetical protein
MHALRGQVQKKKKQILSAAWNLNQVIRDDYDHENPVQLDQRIDIATRAIEITVIGGFDKITWDGASDTYPSKCIMYQLTFEEALTIVHQAHLPNLANNLTPLPRNDLAASSRLSIILGMFSSVYGPCIPVSPSMYLST